MIIGVMSDTYDRLDAIEKAIDFFNSQEVTDILQADDSVSPFVSSRFPNSKPSKNHNTVKPLYSPEDWLPLFAKGSNAFFMIL